MAGRLKCFVASAFEREDVDEIYDKAIRPVLSEFGFQALRVDRVEHNDDIDDKIFELLNSSSFCIADLTYARPSVYFEAGYAQATGRPVIYIARGDHFRGREDDPEGNLRVHFDLQMRNIISWTAPNDAFKTRLKRRIRRVVGPLLLQHQQRQSIETEVQRYNSLSEHDRLAELVVESRQLFRPREFKQIDLSWNRRSTRIPNGPLNEHWECYGRIVNGVYQQVSIVAMSRLDFRSFINPAFGMSHVTLAEEAKLKRIEIIVVAACLQAVRDSTLSRRFPRETPMGDKVFSSKVNREYVRTPISRSYAMIDGVKTSAAFVEQLETILPKFKI
jgi:nucleoside 2-deoxyribosyltransferase